MKINNTLVAGHDIAEQFAIFFEKKVARIVGETAVNQNVYNGRIKMAADPVRSIIKYVQSALLEIIYADVIIN